jgi:2-hydroxychromene-2-carboxylate isomerase
MASNRLTLGLSEEKKAMEIDYSPPADGLKTVGSPVMTKVDFWYEFASTYSYPAAMRVEALGAARGIEIVWRPFLLGPLFAAQGWRDSPFNIYPAKGRYMWRDMRRQCDRLGLPLTRPNPFPQHSLLAARVALSLDGSERAAFSRAVYHAEFGEGRPIAEPATLAPLIEALGRNANRTMAKAQGAANKERLKAECARAAEIGVFGAPSLAAGDGELFWGNDRLEEGLEWELTRTSRVEEGAVVR